MKHFSKQSREPSFRLHNRHRNIDFRGSGKKLIFLSNKDGRKLSDNIKKKIGIAIIDLKPSTLTFHWNL